MIHINLLPTVEEAPSRDKELLFVGGLFTLTLVAIFFVYFSQGTRLTAVRKELSLLESEIASIRKQNQVLEKMAQEKKNIENKIHVVHLLTSPTRRAACVHILDDLSESAPQMLWLMEFSEVKGVAKINGRSVDNQTVAAFARKLSSSRYFKKVEIRETVQEKPAENTRFQDVRGKAGSYDMFSIPITRFLIEAAIDYLPEVEQEKIAKEENTAKEIESQSSKNVSGKRN